jgi:hypothetical protein
MKALRINGSKLLGWETTSRRVKDGVQIDEREQVATISLKTEHEADHDRRASLPRLVVDDALAATRLFVAKKRSEFGELNAFFGELHTGDLA